MNDDNLEMPQQKKASSGRRIIAVLGLLVMAGLGASLLLMGDDASGIFGSVRDKVSDTLTEPGVANLPATSGNANVQENDGSVLPVDDWAATSADSTTASSSANSANGNIIQPPQGYTPPAPAEFQAEGQDQNSEDEGQVEDTGAFVLGRYHPAIPASNSTGNSAPAESGPKTVYSANRTDDVENKGASSGSGSTSGKPASTSSGQQTPAQGQAQSQTQDRIDRALAEAAAPRPVGTSSTTTSSTSSEIASRPTQSVSSATPPATAIPLQNNAPPVDVATREDSVVTRTFIETLATWMVSSYQPVSEAEAGSGKSGSTSASIVSGNAQFGSRLNGLRHGESSPQRGRAAVLNYAYSSGMLDALHRMYGDSLVNSMDKVARSKGHEGRPLTPQQEADMFSLYSESCRQLAASLRGIAAMADMPSKLQEIEKTGQAVTVASNSFADALYSYESAKENGDTAAAEKYRQTMIERSTNSEMALERHAQTKAALTNDIKRRAGGRTFNNDTLVYLAEWVNRRNGDKGESTAMAAEVANRMAEQFAAQSRRLRAAGQ